VVSWEEYQSLGVVKNGSRRKIKDIDELFSSLNTAFSSSYTTKSEIVGIVKKFLINFEHVEKGKNLDSKM